MFKKYQIFTIIFFLLSAITFCDSFSTPLYGRDYSLMGLLKGFILFIAVIIIGGIIKIARWSQEEKKEQKNLNANKQKISNQMDFLLLNNYPSACLSKNMTIFTGFDQQNMVDTGTLSFNSSPNSLNTLYIKLPPNSFTSSPMGKLSNFINKFNI